jgi:cytochrome c-type biogenesis protein CcmF
MQGAIFHSTVGQIGQACIAAGFASALLAVVAYLFGAKGKIEDREGWLKIGKIAVAVHATAILGIVACLFQIITGHYYEYHYAWSHSSDHTPVKYMIACFWEGQEGSFLLWAFWVALLLVAIAWSKNDVPPVAFAVMGGVQMMLMAMIAGVELAGLHIGSSPFTLMREAIVDGPVFAMNPEFVPKDGRGLNPLLQNYWNIIHPPTLFLGFSLTLVPYALSVAQVTGAVFNPKLLKRWLLVATVVLGIGIMMGAYWAYETLNFGGYWNWDPVENAVYIPWLVLVAALHTLLLPRTKPATQLLMHALTQASFLLILYSTFLTRSGVLGETSVHSFTDLGLSGQLLLFLLGFLALTLVIIPLWYRRTAPSVDRHSALEWLIQAGIATLVLAAFQVMASTSIPVVNEIGKLFGKNLHLAPPAEPLVHYTKWQMGFAAGTVLLFTLGQIFWHVPKKDERTRILQWIGLIGLLAGGALVALTSLNKWVDIAFFLLCATATLAAILLLYRLLKTGTRKSGGTIAHMGLAIMLLGILFSAGYSKVVSLNTSGLIYRKDMPDDMNRDNVLLWRARQQQMGQYQLVYRGNRIETTEGKLIDADSIAKIQEGYTAIALADLHDSDDKHIAKRGDTIHIHPENTYFEISYKDTISGEQFMLYPRAQVNPNMGLLASPSVKIRPGYDLYTHVSSIPKPGEATEYGQPQPASMRIGEQFFANDYVAKLLRVEPLDQVGKDYGDIDAGIQAVIEVLGPEKSYLAKPAFLIKGNEIGRIPAEIKELSLRFAVEAIDPEKGNFTISTAQGQQEWIIMKAVKKPFMALVWGGFLIMSSGFLISLWPRRAKKEAHTLPTTKKPSKQLEKV